uniref:Uncharacterized protein n=1 Tax=Stomoxys calcitrans TaxID=35570 RepID=A0A454A0N2_STOCA
MHTGIHIWQRASVVVERLVIKINSKHVEVALGKNKLKLEYQANMLLKKILVIIGVLSLAWPSVYATQCMVAQDVPKTNYSQLLLAINEEQKFESILMVYQKSTEVDTLHQALQKLHVPKISITEQQAAFFYRGFHNVHILAILVLNSTLDFEVFRTLATTLDYMRQTKILTIAMKVQDKQHFKMQLLECCKSYNMTNVLLQFVCHERETECGLLHMLKPYPQYHWSLITQAEVQTNSQYYPQHWRNMQNKTLLTYTDQSQTRSFYFKDAQGELRINGYVARLILLFAERFNASLRMAYPLSVESPTHFDLILINMVRKNLLDLPMVMDAEYVGELWMNWTDAYDYDMALFMVPCAQVLSTREVYAILLNEYFLGCIIASTMLLSVLHSLIDYVFDDLWQPSRLLFSDRIFPGILGQSFAGRSSHSRSLRIVYVLLFIVGLYFNTKFSVNVSTFFTSPPYHKQLETTDDIKKSSLKLLLYETEADHLSVFTVNFVKSIITTNNYTYLRELRQNLNTTYGYVSTLGVWQMLNRQQQFYTYKTFC